MLDACVDEVESSFGGKYYEHWENIGKEGNAVILGVLAEEAKSQRHPMRQACLLDLMRSGHASVNHELFCDIAFDMMRQEIANLKTESSLLTQRDEDGMYLINAIMQNLHWECYLPHEIEKYRQDFVEVAFLVGTFEYKENSDSNEFSFDFLDRAIEKIIWKLDGIATRYAYEPALNCLQAIARHYKSAYWAEEAHKEYISAWRYLNIAYKIHYKDEEIEEHKMDLSKIDNYLEIVAKEQNADFALYSSDNQWLRLLKSGEHIVLFYQDQEGIVWRSRNIDAPDDETLLAFTLRNGDIINLPVAYKIYYSGADYLDLVLSLIFQSFMEAGRVNAHKKRKKDLYQSMYFGLQEYDEDYLGYLL